MPDQGHAAGEDAVVVRYGVGERGRTADGALDPEKIAADLEHWGRVYAEAYANAKLLEKQESIVLATLVQHYLSLTSPRGKPNTRADAMDLARMDETYGTHLETMVEARRLANNANACWRAAQGRLEAMRTAEATRREELKHLRA